MRSAGNDNAHDKASASGSDSGEAITYIPPHSMSAIRNDAYA